MTVNNPARGTCLGDRIAVADTTESRTIGLLRRKTISPGQGLWLKPAFSVHTFGMNFAIDVLFLDAYGKVIGLSPDLQPGRMARNAAASSILELPAGMIAATRTQIGDQLQRAELRQTESALAYAGGNAC
jgi:uncharacterized membrane protein (UPF0127 family)